MECIPKTEKKDSNSLSESSVESPHSSRIKATKLLANNMNK